MTRKFLPPPRPCVVTALELVGLDDPSMLASRVRRAIAVVEEHLADPELARSHRSRLSIHSGRVLHVAPIQAPGMLPFWLVLDMVHLQSDLIGLGMLVRGAVTLGAVVPAGGVVLGPGISRAERLCDEVAGVPRVIVDPLLLREVESDSELRAPHHTAMDELGYLRKLLRMDSDGLWFVDYLRALRNEVSEPGDYLAFLGVHRSLVAQKLEAATALDGSSRMHTWLWRYHDLVVDELKARGVLSDEELAELRIPARGPLVYAFPPSAKAPGEP